jgi:hypothetical protein
MNGNGMGLWGGLYFGLSCITTYESDDDDDDDEDVFGLWRW